MKTYLELDKGKTRDFWQIEVNGETLTTTSGTVGGKKPPKEQIKTAKSAKAAQEAAAKEVAKKKAAFYFDPSSIEGILEAHVEPLAIPTEADVAAHREALPHTPEDYFRVYRTGALGIGFFSDFAPGAATPQGSFHEMQGLFQGSSASSELDDAQALDPIFSVVGQYPDGSAVVLYNTGKYAGRLGLIEHGLNDELLEHVKQDPDATVDAWLKHSLVEPISKVTFSELVQSLLNHYKGAAVTRLQALRDAVEAVRAAVSGDPLKVTQLDLSEKGLRALPDFLSDCENLEVLTLRKNEFAAIPAVLRTMKKLRELDLFYNGLNTSALPAWLSELPLTKLDLRINTGGGLAPVLCTLERLQELRLPEVDSLPASIGALSALRTLEVGEVKGLIEEGGVGRLEALEELDLGRLKAPLPADIGGLKSLRLFKFEVTPIQGFALPASIAKLKALRTLHVGASTLTDALCELDALEELKASGNEAGLPERLGALRSLRKLDLNYARMTSLPDSFGDLQNLEHLNLESSDLKTLPDSFARLTRLRFLNLGTRTETEIGELLCGFENLEFLALNTLSIHTLRGSMAGLRNLTTLKVYSSNEVDPTPFLAFVHDLPALKKLGVPYNRKEHFRQALPGVEID